MTETQSNAAGNTSSAREVAVTNVRRFLQEVLSEARDLGGWVGYDFTVFGGPQYAGLAQTYLTTHQLPTEGQRLWRRLEGLIDTNLRDDTDPLPDWATLAGVLDDCLQWLTTQYSAKLPPPEHDPGDYERRIVLDESALTVRLLGVPYRVERMAHIRLFKVLLSYARDRRGNVAMDVIATDVFGPRGKRKAVQRLREGLPPALAALIQGRSGQGVCLVLPPTLCEY